MFPLRRRARLPKKAPHGLHVASISLDHHNRQSRLKKYAGHFGLQARTLRFLFPARETIFLSVSRKNNKKCVRFGIFLYKLYNI